MLVYILVCNFLSVNELGMLSVHWLVSVDGILCWRYADTHTTECIYIHVHMTVFRNLTQPIAL